MSYRAIAKHSSLTVVPDFKPRKKENRTDAQIANEINLSRGERNGYFSDKTKSLVKTRIDHLIFLQDYAKSIEKHSSCYLTFVTLTLPSNQKHQDKEIKRKIFDEFLKALIRKYGIDCYLWVTEAQKNGHIHFHILVDKFLDNRTSVKDKNGNVIENRNPKDANYQAITKLWNHYLDKLGYISAYQNNMKAMYSNGFKFNPMQSEEKDVYNEKTGKFTKKIIMVDEATQQERYDLGLSMDWTLPNTADVHALKAKNNVKGYICKYMTKNDQQKEGLRKIEGALWGCSDNLREMKNFECLFDEDLQNTILDMKLEIPDSLKTIFITNEGNLQEKEFHELQKEKEKIKVFAEIHNYRQMDFWAYAPDSFKEKFKNFYKEFFESIYKTNSQLTMATPQKRTLNNLAV